MTNPTDPKTERERAAFDEGFRAGRGYERLSSAGREHRERREGAGLAPEEAEEGARRMYGHAFDPRAPWPQMMPGYRKRLTEAYRFAHAEGFRAAKGKGWKVAERVREATRRAQFVAAQLGGLFGYDEAAGLARELEALAAELEGAK